MKRTHLLLVAALVALGLGLGAASAHSGTTIGVKHFFWSQQASTPTSDQLQNDLLYHGGNVGDGAVGVLTKPSAYLIYWGTEWSQGFTTADTDGKTYSSKTLVNYLNTFVKNLGGSPWMAVQTQYCRGIAAGSATCAGDPNAQYIQNPKGQLKGVWIDPAPVPDAIIANGLAENLTDDPIASEAMRAAAHFKYDPNAVYIIMTPPRPVATGQPAYCGYHSQTTSIDGYGNPFRLQYAFIPWQNTSWPGLGQGCGLHNVNAKSNSFGNGIFDSWSIVVGHEYGEAITDPDAFFGAQDRWNDDQTSENGDKCAWTETQNITLAGHPFAVQPMWSNEAFDAGKDGCQVKR
jgi:serine protease